MALGRRPRCSSEYLCAPGTHAGSDHPGRHAGVLHVPTCARAHATMAWQCGDADLPVIVHMTHAV